MPVALAACAQPSGVPGVDGQPDIRVGVVASEAYARLGGTGRVAALIGGRAAFRLSAGDEVRVTAVGQGISAIGPGVADRYERLTLVSLDRSQFVMVNDRPYRGVLEVFADQGGVTVVNELPLELYLLGVVNAEMGRRASNERAALEAQAVVSRTYALANRGKYATRGYDVRGTVADQAYGGVTSETAMGRAVVQATAGMVVTYRGTLVAPFFHSTCGFSTASPDEVFRTGRRTPYLRPVSDQRRGGYYCDASPKFRWSVEWGGTVLLDILQRTVPSVLGIDARTVDAVRDIRVHRTGPSGRVTEMRIGVSGGEIPVFGPDLRSVLTTPDGRPLGSTALELAVERGGGVVRRLTASGAGWGHGVGLCQWGAVGRAREGQNMRAIVTTYFPGTRVESWY